jgi:beta-glucanase (GH16 family)
LTFVFVSAFIKGQTPLNDQNWYIDTGKSDEFNSTAINPNKWHVLDCPSGDCCNWGGGTAFEKGNTMDSAGLLRFRVDGPGLAPIPCSRGTYATGGIQSDSENYTYGYYEIYAKLPGFYDKGVPCGLKFWPTFWMAYQQFDTSCLVVGNEVDILEPNGTQYANGSTNVCGWWYLSGNCQSKKNQGIYNSPVPLFTGFHKYAVETLPNAVIFYFDDVPFFENYNSPTMIMHPMRLYIDQQLQDTSIKFNPNTPFPQYYTIDYFRYYRLNLACGVSTTLLDNIDIANYVFSVKSDITFGNGLNSISLNSTDVKYFRAVNSITINGTFTAPLGSELALIPTPCN